jgi:hypothetical protein
LLAYASSSLGAPHILPEYTRTVQRSRHAADTEKNRGTGFLLPPVPRIDFPNVDSYFFAAAFFAVRRTPFFAVRRTPFFAVLRFAAAFFAAGRRAVFFAVARLAVPRFAAFFAVPRFAAFFAVAFRAAFFIATVRLQKVEFGILRYRK